MSTAKKTGVTVTPAPTKAPPNQFLVVVEDRNGDEATQIFSTLDAAVNELSSALGTTGNGWAHLAVDDDDYLDETTITIYEVVGSGKRYDAKPAGVSITPRK